MKVRVLLVSACVGLGVFTGCSGSPDMEAQQAFPKFLRAKWGAPSKWVDRDQWLNSQCARENPCARPATKANLQDPAPGDPKMLAASWACGTREVRAANVREGEFLVAECPAPTPSNAGITIVAAHFGDSNALHEVRRVCTGKVLCEQPSSTGFFNDENPGATKTLRIVYRCGTETSSRSAAAVEGSVASMRC